MDLVFSILLLLANGVLTLFLAVKIMEFGPAAGVHSLFALLVSISIWSFGFALEIQTPDLATKMLWANIQYLGIAAVPSAWAAFALAYYNIAFVRRNLRWILPSLLVIPVVTVVLIWTNDTHHWYTIASRIQYSGSIPLVYNQRGFWFWIWIGYSYLLILAGTIFFLLRQIKLYPQGKKNSFYILLAVLLPWIGNILHVSELISGIDPSIFGFSISAVILAYTVFHLNFLNMLPIVQRKVMDTSKDGIFVLDKHNKLLSYNRSAGRILGEPDGPSAYVGCDFSAVFPQASAALENLEPWQEALFEIQTRDGIEAEYFEVEATPVTISRNSVSGRLVLVRDISKKKQADQKLLQYQNELEERVLERTEAISQLADQRRRLFDVTLAMVSTFSLDEVIYRFLRTLDQILSFSVCIIYWYDETNKTFFASETVAQEPEVKSLVPQILQDGEGIVGRTARSGKSWLVNNAHLDPASYYLPDVKMPYVEHVVSVPIFFKEKVIGVFQVSRVKDKKPFSQDEYQLIQLFVAQANSAIQNARLYTELEQYVEDLRLEREQVRAMAVRLNEVREEDQLLLAQELHDRLGQNLSALNLNLNIVEKLLPNPSDPSLLNRLGDSKHILQETIQEIRNMMAELRPSLLDDYGLTAALQSYIEKFCERTLIPVHFSGAKIQPRLPVKSETAIFRTIQEALNNVAKHAAARHIEVVIHPNETHVQFSIQDDGSGFSLENLKNRKDREHWGLLIMQERINGINGSLSIASAPGKGTKILIEVPR